MRRSLTFACEGEALIGTLDEGDSDIGLLIVTGGKQTRIGPHRMMATLARDLAQSGYPVFRFDRRGLGDSSGSDPGFGDSDRDIEAAIEIFRTVQPQLKHIWSLGLCDGATALALHHDQLSLDGLILLNPWVVEAEPNNPAPAALRAHYADRLRTLSGWSKAIGRLFNPARLIGELRGAFSISDQSLANDVMASLARFRGPVSILLADRDATARAFIDVYRGPAGKPLNNARNVKLVSRNSDSHSFAGPGDHAWLTEAIFSQLSA